MHERRAITSQVAGFHESLTEWPDVPRKEEGQATQPIKKSAPDSSFLNMQRTLF